MISEEKNIEIKCLNCELYKKEIQEKDIKIKTLESNLLKIKSLLSESGSLIDGYNEIMEENKNLKMEIERLNNTINKTSNENYQFDLLKKKILRFQEENEKLRSSMQFYESQKNQNLHLKNGNEIKIKRELSLKDKEINELNTVISILKLKHNEQKLTNEEILKNYNKNSKNNILDDEIKFLDNNNNNEDYNYNIDNEYRNNNIINDNLYSNLYTNNTNYNNIKTLDLIKEKEYLSNEYQRYKQKYIIYKFKYHEFKKASKIFLNTMKVIPPGNNILDFIDSLNDKKNTNFLGNKRLNSFQDKDEFKTNDNLFNVGNINVNNERKKSEESFKNFLKFPSVNPNSQYDDKDDDMNIEEEDNNDKKGKTKKKKTTKKGKTRNKKNVNKSSKSNSKDKDNSDDINKNTKSKKRGRKPKKSRSIQNTENKKEIKKEKNELKNEQKEEKEEKEDKIEKEKKENEEEKKVEKNIKKENSKKEENKENISEDKNIKIIKIESETKIKNKQKEEIIKEKESKIIEQYIGPVPKNIKKKLDPAAQQALNTNNILNLLSNNPEKITEEKINSLLLQSTVQEKTSYLFDIIISNLITLELSRVLTLFEVFLDGNQDSKSIIGANILENINLHLNTSSLLNNKIHLKIANKSNETYKTYITENFSSPIFIISFLIDILYRRLNDLSCLSHFLFQLVFDKNLGDKNKSKILVVLINTRKEKIVEINNKLFYKEEQYNKYTAKENENKFYFFLTYKSTLISEKIFDFILTIYAHQLQSDKKEEEIINKLNNILDSIPAEDELKINIPNFPEVYKSSLKFNQNIFFIEIFQALCIIVEVKEIKWIAEKVFSNVLWKIFQNSKKESLKRALSIYYTSLLFYLCLKNGIKNKGNENLLEQQEFSRIYGWLYSLYNPQPQFENLISFYERLCAMSWIVESPIMTMSNKVVESIKEVVNNIIVGEKETLCPSDFMEKLKKIKLI